MCGISVIFGKNLVEFKKINQLVGDLSHRGPDNTTIKKINQNLIFGHNRLKIVDLSDKANQPFVHKNVSLLFNGMIYNFLELEKEISTQNFNFKTNCDTEVILAAYLKWGEKCFSKLTGMFSIVLWDDKKKKLFCVRDRLGIKPLYYTTKDKNLYFSSELTPLKKITSFKPNNLVISDYINYSLYENKSNTFFKNIKQIEPGYIYKFDIDNKFSKFKYWSLFDIIKKKDNSLEKKSQNNIKEKIIERIQEIKKIYSISNVKSAAFLSSGLDSFVLTDFLLESDKKLKLLLSFGFNSDSKDELSQIQKTHKMKKINHKKIRFTFGNFFKNLDEVNSQQESPWGGPNIYFMGELLKFAKKNKFKVAYNADGADEIFGGYKKYLRQLKINSFSVNKSYFNLHIDGTTTDVHDLSHDLFLKKTYEYSKEVVKIPSIHNITNQRYLDIVYNKLPRNFRFSDRFSMNNSIELRYPFLDHKLLELSFELNKSNLINNKKNKILLRDSVKNYKINKKRHINGPQTEWIYRREIFEYLNKIMKKSPIFEGYLDKKKTKNYINHFYKTRKSNSFKIWQIINLDLFLRDGL